MRLELVKRPQQSKLFSALSPVIAFGLTIVAGAILFMVLDKNPATTASDVAPIMSRRGMVAASRYSSARARKPSGGIGSSIRATSRPFLAIGTPVSPLAFEGLLRRHAPPKRPEHGLMIFFQ